MRGNAVVRKCGKRDTYWDNLKMGDFERVDKQEITVDIEKIMTEIRADIAKRGLKADLPPFNEFELSSHDGDSHQSDFEIHKLEQALAAAGATAYLNPFPRVGSRFGKIGILFKRLIRKLIHFQITPIVQEQSSHNQAVINTLIQLRDFVKYAVNENMQMAELYNNLQELYKGDILRLTDRLAELERKLVETDRKIEETEHKLVEAERKIYEHSAETERKLFEQRNYIVTQSEKAELNAFRYASKLKENDIVTDKKTFVPSLISGDVDIDYFDFENHFRGTRELIKERQQMYLPLFEGKDNIIDLGCGRGEFMELLKEHGMAVKGVDITQEYVDWCKFKGLDAVHGDAVNYLASLQDASTDGIVGMQIAEHLPTHQLLELCRLAYEKLKDGGVFVLETPNPACLSVYANAFYIDPTHIKPIHHLQLQYIAEKSGFKDVKVVFTECSKVGFEIPHIDTDSVRNLAAFNDAMTALNQLLFGSQDYAIIAVK